MILHLTWYNSFISYEITSTKDRMLTKQAWSQELGWDHKYQDERWKGSGSTCTQKKIGWSQIWVRQNEWSVLSSSGVHGERRDGWVFTQQIRRQNHRSTRQEWIKERKSGVIQEKWVTDKIFLSIDEETAQSFSQSQN